MALMVSDELRVLFLAVTGDEFPDVNEDLLRELADAWDRAGKRLREELGSALPVAVARIRAEFAGEAEQAFAAVMTPFVDGEDNFIDSAAHFFHDIAEFLRELALDVEYMKYVVITELSMLAAEFKWALAMTVFFGSLPLLWFGGRALMARATIKSVITWVERKLPLLALIGGQARTLFTKLHWSLRTLLIGSTVSLGNQVLVTTGAQTAQFAKHTRTTWTNQYFNQAAVVGAWGGLLAPLTAAAGHKLTTTLAKILDGGRIFSHTALARDMHQRFAHSISHIVQESLHEGLTAAAATASLGQFSLSWADFTAGASSGVARVSGKIFGHLINALALAAAIQHYRTNLKHHPRHDNDLDSLYDEKLHDDGHYYQHNGLDSDRNGHDDFSRFRLLGGGTDNSSSEAHRTYHDGIYHGGGLRGGGTFDDDSTSDNDTTYHDSDNDSLYGQGAHNDHSAEGSAREGDAHSGDAHGDGSRYEQVPAPPPYQRNPAAPGPSLSAHTDGLAQTIPTPPPGPAPARHGIHSDAPPENIGHTARPVPAISTGVTSTGRGLTTPLHINPVTPVPGMNDVPERPGHRDTPVHAEATATGRPAPLAVGSPSGHGGHNMMSLRGGGADTPSEHDHDTASISLSEDSAPEDNPAPDSRPLAPADIVAKDLAALTEVVGSKRFPHPNTYAALVKGSGTDRAGAPTTSTEAAMAAHSTWYGQPLVAGALEIDDPSTVIKTAIGDRLEHIPGGAKGLARVVDSLTHNGMAALLVVEESAESCTSFNIVLHAGLPYFLDPSAAPGESEESERTVTALTPEGVQRIGRRLPDFHVAVFDADGNRAPLAEFGWSAINGGREAIALHTAYQTQFAGTPRSRLRQTLIEAIPHQYGQVEEVVARVSTEGRGAAATLVATSRDGREQAYTIINHDVAVRIVRASPGEIDLVSPRASEFSNLVWVRAVVTDNHGTEVSGPHGGQTAQEISSTVQSIEESAADIAGAPPGAAGAISRPVRDITDIVARTDGADEAFDFHQRRNTVLPAPFLPLSEGLTGFAELSLKLLLSTGSDSPDEYALAATSPQEGTQGQMWTVGAEAGRIITRNARTEQLMDWAALRDVSTVDGYVGKPETREQSATEGERRTNPLFSTARREARKEYESAETRFAHELHRYLAGEYPGWPKVVREFQKFLKFVWDRLLTTHERHTVAAADARTVLVIGTPELDDLVKLLDDINRKASWSERLPGVLPFEVLNGTASRSAYDLFTLARHVRDHRGFALDLSLLRLGFLQHSLKFRPGSYHKTMRGAQLADPRWHAEDADPALKYFGNNGRYRLFPIADKVLRNTLGPFPDEYHAATIETPLRVTEQRLRATRNRRRVDRMEWLDKRLDSLIPPLSELLVDRRRSVSPPEPYDPAAPAEAVRWRSDLKRFPGFLERLWSDKRASEPGWTATRLSEQAGEWTTTTLAEQATAKEVHAGVRTSDTFTEAYREFSRRDIRLAIPTRHHLAVIKTLGNALTRDPHTDIDALLTAIADGLAREDNAEAIHRIRRYEDARAEAAPALGSRRDFDPAILPSDLTYAEEQLSHARTLLYDEFRQREARNVPTSDYRINSEVWRDRVAAMVAHAIHAGYDGRHAARILAEMHFAEFDPAILPGALTYDQEWLPRARALLDEEIQRLDIRGFRTSDFMKNSQFWRDRATDMVAHAIHAGYHGPEAARIVAEKHFAVEVSREAAAVPDLPLPRQYGPDQSTEAWFYDDDGKVRKDFRDFARDAAPALEGLFHTPGRPGLTGLPDKIEHLDDVWAFLEFVREKSGFWDHLPVSMANGWPEFLGDMPVTNALDQLAHRDLGPDSLGFLIVVPVEPADSDRSQPNSMDDDWNEHDRPYALALVTDDTGLHAVRIRGREVTWPRSLPGEGAVFALVMRPDVGFVVGARRPTGIEFAHHIRTEFEKLHATPGHIGPRELPVVIPEKFATGAEGAREVLTLVREGGEGTSGYVYANRVSRWTRSATSDLYLVVHDGDVKFLNQMANPVDPGEFDGDDVNDDVEVRAVVFGPDRTTLAGHEWEGVEVTTQSSTDPSPATRPPLSMGEVLKDADSVLALDRVLGYSLAARELPYVGEGAAALAKIFAGLRFGTRDSRIRTAMVAVQHSTGNGLKLHLLHLETSSRRSYGALISDADDRDTILVNGESFIDPFPYPLQRVGAVFAVTSPRREHARPFLEWAGMDWLEGLMESASNGPSLRAPQWNADSLGNRARGLPRDALGPDELQQAYEILSSDAAAPYIGQHELTFPIVELIAHKALPDHLDTIVEDLAMSDHRIVPLRGIAYLPEALIRYADYVDGPGERPSGDPLAHLVKREPENFGTGSAGFRAIVEQLKPSGPNQGRAAASGARSERTGHAPKAAAVVVVIVRDARMKYRAGTLVGKDGTVYWSGFPGDGTGEREAAPDALGGELGEDVTVFAVGTRPDGTFVTPTRPVAPDSAEFENHHTGSTKSDTWPFSALREAASEAHSSQHGHVPLHPETGGRTGENERPFDPLAPSDLDDSDREEWPDFALRGGGADTLAEFENSDDDDATPPIPGREAALAVQSAWYGRPVRTVGPGAPHSPAPGQEAGHGYRALARILDSLPNNHATALLTIDYGDPAADTLNLLRTPDATYLVNARAGTRLRLTPGNIPAIGATLGTIHATLYDNDGDPLPLIPLDDYHTALYDQTQSAHELRTKAATSGDTVLPDGTGTLIRRLGKLYHIAKNRAITPEFAAELAATIDHEVIALVMGADPDEQPRWIAFPPRGRPLPVKPEDLPPEARAALPDSHRESSNQRRG